MKRIETEKKYYCNDIKKLIRIATSLDFKLLSSKNEIDEYFTDIDSEYIKNRTCLRIRKTNNEKMEITFKGKSNTLTNLYSKLENNIDAYIDEYDDYVKLFYNLGYHSYVIVDKDRITYSYSDNNYEYNIMIDSISGIGSFVEFEILSSKQIDSLEKKLERFIDKFKSVKLEEVNEPYRDIVAKNILTGMKNGNIVDKIYINIDSILLKYERDFYNKYNDVSIIDEYFNNISSIDDLHFIMYLLNKINYNISYLTKFDEKFLINLFLKNKYDINKLSIVKKINDSNYLYVDGAYKEIVSKLLVIDNNIIK